MKRFREFLDEDKALELPMSRGLTRQEAEFFEKWVDVGVFFLDPIPAKTAVNMFKKIYKKIPKKYQKIPSKPVYRGIKIPRKLAEDFYAGKTIKMKDKGITSWTYDPENARGYAIQHSLNTIGVVVKQPIVKSKALIYLSSGLIEYLMGDVAARILFQDEVVIEGHLIKELSIKSVYKLVER